MARSARSRGPFGDPRLVERRGDLRGPSALLLVLLMVCGMGGMGALLLGFGRLVPGTGSTILPAFVSAADPGPSRTSGPGPTPAVSPVPTVALVAIVDPGAMLATIGDRAPITEGGQQVGTVTLDSAVYRTRIQGRDPPRGSRWLRISVTYRATAPLTVDPTRWSAVDTRDRRHGWTGAAAPDPPLDASSLASGQSRTGYVVIVVPTNVDTRSVVLQDAAGRDIVVFTIR